MKSICFLLPMGIGLSLLIVGLYFVGMMLKGIAPLNAEVSSSVFIVLGLVVMVSSKKEVSHGK